jgi:hypothetical protein
MPSFLAGSRDPVTAASLMYVASNPNQHGDGIETEVAIGATLPVLLISGRPNGSPLVLGLEAGVFARFGLQLLERELISTDWLFALPLYWHRDRGWLRFRYYHTSSHMGDEYVRRFGDEGVNFSRDAAEVMGFRKLGSGAGVYGGARYAYNVHPEESERWVLRTGAQWEAVEDRKGFRAFLAGDLEWDQDTAGMRTEIQLGTWLPPVAERRAIRMALVLLVGPSPLGQFDGADVTQFGITLRGRL